MDSFYLELVNKCVIGRVWNHFLVLTIASVMYVVQHVREYIHVSVSVNGHIKFHPLY